MTKFPAIAFRMLYFNALKRAWPTLLPFHAFLFKIDGKERIIIIDTFRFIIFKKWQSDIFRDMRKFIITDSRLICTSNVPLSQYAFSFYFASPHYRFASRR